MAEAVVDEDHIYCDRDVLADRYVLGSTLSLERRPLPQGTFDLIFEEGHGFVYRLEDPDGEIAPVSDMLRLRVVAIRDTGSDDILDYEVGEGVASEKVSQLRRVRVMRSASISVVESVPDRSVAVGMAVFTRPRGGCRCFFSFQDVHSFFGFTQYSDVGSAASAKWINHMYGSFEASLRTRWLLPEQEHMQKSREYRRGGSEVDSSTSARTLPWHGGSTHALLALLFQWCYLPVKDGGFVQPADVRKAEVCLLSLVSGAHSFGIVMPEAVQWDLVWPRFVHSEFCIVLEVSDGEVDLSSLQQAAQAGHLCCQKWIKVLQPTDAVRTPLIALLPHLGASAKDKATRDEALVVARLVLRAIAYEVDRVLSTAPVTDEHAAPLCVLAPEGTSFERSLHETMCGHMAAAKRLTARTFPQALGISFCNDDSNVRTHELSVTVAVLPSNAAMWTPCQVKRRAATLKIIRNISAN